MSMSLGTGWMQFNLTLLVAGSAAAPVAIFESSGAERADEEEEIGRGSFARRRRANNINFRRGGN